MMLTDREALLQMLGHAGPEHDYMTLDVREGQSEVRIGAGMDDATASFFFSPEGRLLSVSVDESRWEDLR